MRRRKFITLLGGAMAAWPLGAGAEVPEQVRLIGFLDPRAENDPIAQSTFTAFRQELAAHGWIQGRNVRIESRFAAGDYRRMTTDAGTLVSLKPEVIVTLGSPGLTAVREHSQTLPVVFVLVSAPVRLGFIESLARPGGYATGFTNFEFSIGGKWLELLRAMKPQVTRVTLIVNPANPSAGQLSQFIATAGPLLDIEVMTASVRTAADIEAAIAAVPDQTRSGLIVFPDGLLVVHRDLIIGLAARHRIPAIYPYRDFPKNGGLLSYGLDTHALFRQAALYVDRILWGAKPADLPVQAPNKFELVVNVKTAQAIGLTVPQSLLATADEVIE